MTKAEEILEKHLANNIDQRTYLKCSKLTYDICIDAINEAINYTCSCTTFYCSDNQFTKSDKCNKQCVTCLEMEENKLQ